MYQCDCETVKIGTFNDLDLNLAWFGYEKFEHFVDHSHCCLTYSNTLSTSICQGAHDLSHQIRKASKCFYSILFV